MKVIEAGKIGEYWSIKHRCTGWGNSGKGCEALLEIDFDDLRYCTPIHSDSWGGREAAVSFKCPCCGKVTDLGLNDWPSGHHELKQWTKEWHDAAPGFVD